MTHICMHHKFAQSQQNVIGNIDSIVNDEAEAAVDEIHTIVLVSKESYINHGSQIKNKIGGTCHLVNVSSSLTFTGRYGGRGLRLGMVL